MNSYCTKSDYQALPEYEQAEIIFILTGAADSGELARVQDKKRISADEEVIFKNWVDAWEHMETWKPKKPKRTKK